MTAVSASILSADFCNLEQEIKLVEKAGAKYIHCDVMDGNFVPNITIGPCVIKSIKKVAKTPLDVHLMINNPEIYIDDFAYAGADLITFHFEACTHHHKIIQNIKRLNKSAGISIVPSTPVSAIEYIIDDIDLILIMTVNPGFGGQAFIEAQARKIIELNELTKKTNSKKLISVDGGINHHTSKIVRDLGIDIIVSGQYIFGEKEKNYKKQIENLLND